MGSNPYPVDIASVDGPVVLSGEVTFTDPDNQPGGGSLPGTVLPVGISDGATVDDSTYESPIGDGGPLTTLVFPGSVAALGIAIAGDDFPRIIMGSDPTDVLFYLGDGTFDPSSGANISVVDGQLNLNGKGAAGVALSGPTFVSGKIDAQSLGATIPFVVTQHGAPSTYQTPLVKDVDSNILYAWMGSAYVPLGTIV